jgi:hypothetical protein
MGPNAALELGQQAPADPESPRRLGDPHPLDVGRCVAVELETSTTHWLPAQGCDEEQPGRRPHRVDPRGATQRRVESGVEPAIDLGEVGVQAPLGRGLRRVHGLDVDQGGGEQPLDVSHRGNQPGALGLAERLEERPCQLVAAPIEHAALGRAGRREAGRADPPVALVRADVDESRRLQ